MKGKGIFLTTLFIVSILFFTSCNNGDENNIPAGKGHLSVHLTDTPFPIDMISSTTVTIDNVEIRKQMEDAMGEDKDTFIVLSNKVMKVNLLELTNGLTEQIATSDLDAGNYDMIRLHVVDATVELKDGSTYDLKIPSGSTSGIKVKINPAVYLTEGQTYDVLLDFDVSRSFVLKGNLKHIVGFNFKPVIRGVFLGAAGRIEGNVTDTSGVNLENALVKSWISEYNDKLKSDSTDVHIVSSFTDFDGNYKLVGLPEGIYTVVCSHDGYKNDTVKNVSVMVGESTPVNFSLEEVSE